MYFNQVGIPYFNSLTANQLGFQTDFSAHDPADSVYNAILGLQSWFQSPTGTLPQGPAVTQADIDREKAIYGNTPPPIYDERYRKQRQLCLHPITGETIPCDQPATITPTSPDVPHYPESWKTNPPADVPIGTPGTTTKDNIEKQQPFSPIDLEGFLKSDTAIATGLIVLAVILGIVGIVSLR